MCAGISCQSMSNIMKYNRYDGDEDTEYVSCGLDSSSSDSERDLHEMEELLYGQVHYETNTLYCNTNAVEDNDITVTTMESSNGCKAGIANDVETATELAEPNEEPTLDVKNRLCANNQSTPVDDSESSDANTQNKKSKRDDVIELNGCEYIVLDSEGESVSSSRAALTDPDTTCRILSPGGDESRKSKQAGKTRLKHLAKTPTVVANVSRKKKPVVVIDSSSSDSESSYDAVCFDDSSLDSTETERDDIKIHFTRADGGEKVSDVVQLRQLLESLPDCNWDVGGQDRTLNTTFSSRYYQSKARCYNCTDRGHATAKCPLPKKVYACLLCGKRGHIARSCSDSLCFVCHTPGHAARDCSNSKRRYDQCRRCGVRGHIEIMCPDQWRQYHLTTDGSGLVKADRKINAVKFCYNCSHRGHFGHDCDEPRMDRFSSALSPFIIKYDDGLSGQQFYKADKVKAADKKHLQKKERSRSRSGRSSSDDIDANNDAIASDVEPTRTKSVYDRLGSLHTSRSVPAGPGRMQSDFPRSSSAGSRLNVANSKWEIGGISNTTSSNKFGDRSAVEMGDRRLNMQSNRASDRSKGSNNASVKATKSASGGRIKQKSFIAVQNAPDSRNIGISQAIRGSKTEAKLSSSQLPLAVAVRDDDGKEELRLTKLRAKRKWYRQRRQERLKLRKMNGGGIATVTVIEDSPAKKLSAKSRQQNCAAAVVTSARGFRMTINR